ncbi:mobilization protein [Algibacillus agarilyticus]|uniref:mobilization protein n=1 Tax=Algibacillus agarilyticus TaxID=2234133 RepID=UPI000DD0C215|nr:mobilization protein [Algibacillus agarilyticus]
MRKVHFVGGEKGGVGKSMTSRVFAQYCIDNDQPFLGFDCDSSHGTFSRFYNEFASPVILGEEDSLDKMLTSVDENPKHDLIIDLAAQAAQPLEKWIDETDVLGLFEELEYQVYMWHVMDDGADSVHLLDKLLTRYEASAVKFVIVQNFGRGTNFSQLQKSQAYAKAVARGAIILELPKLQTKLTQKIDFENTSFWAVANNKSIMNIAERQRMKVWLRNVYKQFDLI